MVLQYSLSFVQLNYFMITVYLAFSTAVGVSFHRRPNSLALNVFRFLSRSSKHTMVFNPFLDVVTYVYNRFYIYKFRVYNLRILTSCLAKALTRWISLFIGELSACMLYSINKGFSLLDKF